jgi:hypothetical protein
MCASERDFFGLCFRGEEDRPTASSLRGHDWLKGGGLNNDERKVLRGIVDKVKRGKVEKSLTTHDTDDAAMVIVKLRVGKGMKGTPEREEIRGLSQMMGMFEVTVVDSFARAEKR